ncbi:MAG: hypothetical protein CSB49_00735 [Proteobacteria bacterium]|nr:MAG: hypothetical protein CSB49_00735 [Pseudomonadota bacterium]
MILDVCGVGWCRAARSTHWTHGESFVFSAIVFSAIVFSTIVFSEIVVIREELGISCGLLATHKQGESCGPILLT